MHLFLAQCDCGSFAFPEALLVLSECLSVVLPWLVEKCPQDFTWLRLVCLTCNGKVIHCPQWGASVCIRHTHMKHSNHDHSICYWYTHPRKPGLFPMQTTTDKSPNDWVELNYFIDNSWRFTHENSVNTRRNKQWLALKLSWHCGHPRPPLPLKSLYDLVCAVVCSEERAFLEWHFYWSTPQTQLGVCRSKEKLKIVF